MADSKKSTVVIASVLKPVDDSRMYEKVGLSLAASGKYEVHVIGCESVTTQQPGVVQHPFRPFRRLSVRRLLQPWRILFLSFRLRPELFIATTHELLFVALLLKMARRCRVVYDVQENYYWNILYTPAFPLLLKPFVASYVRAKEILSARFVDHFLLAEKGYARELAFPRNKFTIIENKVRIDGLHRDTPASPDQKKTIELIFSGTIAETTGVFTAIDLAVKLHVIDDRVRLTIIGFCAQPQVLKKIQLMVQTRPFIKVIARDTPVPHAEIFGQVALSDFGLITYRINPSTANSIPTKMYEYLGFKLPILLVNHKPWVDYCHPYAAAVVFDAAHIDAVAIYGEMMTRTFYTAGPEGVYWSTEEPKLLEAIGKVL